MFLRTVLTALHYIYVVFAMILCIFAAKTFPFYRYSVYPGKWANFTGWGAEPSLPETCFTASKKTAYLIWSNSMLSAI